MNFVSRRCRYNPAGDDDTYRNHNRHCTKVEKMALLRHRSPRKRYEAPPSLMA
jgi:hypothetical protein